MRSSSSSTAMMLTCWVQVCWQKSKCPSHSCQDKSSSAQQQQQSRRKVVGSAARAMDSDAYGFRETSLRFTVEDPYGSGQQSLGESIKPRSENLPNVIGIITFSTLIYFDKWTKNGIFISMKTFFSPNPNLKKN